jgi:hypothetical protein
MSAKHLKIGSLLLDQNNPRIDPVSSQREALQQVLDDQEEKLANLAEDIVEIGLSPTDNFLVMRSATAHDKFIALEGNRRLAALKILQNPQVLTGLEVSNGLKRRFENVAKEFKADDIEPISCFEVASRDDANVWIQRRHIGEDEGRGIVSWNAQSAARFRGGEPALQALEFVREHGDLTREQLALLGGRFITTLKRLLETPDVRDILGLDMGRKRLFSLVTAEEVVKGLRRIVLDLAEKNINVTQLKKKQQMVDYVRGFGKNDKPDLRKTINPSVPLDELLSSGPSTGLPPPTPPRKPPSRPAPPRLSVVAKPFKLNVTNSKALEIYEELKVLRLASHPHAIAVLSRVFLEISVDLHLAAIGSTATFKEPKSGRVVDKSLRSKVDECIKHHINRGANAKDFAAITRAMSLTSLPLSPDLLHAYVHNSFVTPTERDLTAAWDGALPLFERIWP